MPITFHPDGRITGATVQANVTGQLTNTGTQTGQILETIAATCDGRTVAVPSGNYTITDVTTGQTATTSFTTCNGSEINYTPPTGTKQLVYSYNFHWDCLGLSGICHYRFSVDGTVVTPAQKTFASNYASTNWHHAMLDFFVGYTLDLNAGSDDLSQGKLRHNTWTSPKTLKIEFRGYNTSYTHRIHANQWWNGDNASGGALQPIKPQLFIQAIA